MTCITLQGKYAEKLEKELKRMKKENKKINELIETQYKKLDAQDKIIEEQALEIAKLKEQNKHIEQWWKETNVIIRNNKSLAINDNAMDYILGLELKRHKSIEWINNVKNNPDYIYSSPIISGEDLNELLEILGGNND